MTTTGTEPSEGTGNGRRAVAKGVVLTLTGATAVTGGGLLALGSAMTASAQTEGATTDLVVDPGSIVIIGQDAEVANLGLGLANSGLNLAVGNSSENGAAVDQATGWHPVRELEISSVSGGGGGVLQLTGTASNTSSGTASITTGAATATGNSAATTIGQSGASAAAAGSGIAIVEQHAEVENAGVGIANSGLNLAIGNASSNGAGVSQVALGGGTTSATATASNTSGGTASITSGAASATGNSSSVSITQG
jgi:hypothetical protein